MKLALNTYTIGIHEQVQSASAGKGEGDAHRRGMEEGRRGEGSRRGEKNTLNVHRALAGSSLAEQNREWRL